MSSSLTVGTRHSEQGASAALTRTQRRSPVHPSAARRVARRDSSRSPAIAAGDRLAFMSAGAYGAVLSSAYNARPLVPEVLVDGYRYEIVRRRPSFEESIGLEKVPDWLTTVA